MASNTTPGASAPAKTPTTALLHRAETVQEAAYAISCIAKVLSELSTLESLAAGEPIEGWWGDHVKGIALEAV